MAFICIDIGGTNTLLGIGNGDFEIKKEMKTKKFLSNIKPNIKQVIEDSRHEENDFSQVLVAAGGPVDVEEGVFYPPNLENKEMKEVDINDKLEPFGEVELINDCNSAVLGEYVYGEHKTENLIYVTISSGIGAGLILDGNLVEGFNGNIGEIGHMELGNQVKCGCGQKGHWEAYSSGNGMPKMAKTLYNLDFENSLEIFREYEKDSPDAKKVIEKMHEMNRKGFENLVNLYNPEKIVLGGAVALNHQKTIIEPLKNRLEGKTVNDTPEISKCSLGEEAVIHGLRAIANQEKPVPNRLKK